MQARSGPDPRAGPRVTCHWQLMGIWRSAGAGASEEKPRGFGKWALGEETVRDLWVVGVASTSSGKQSLQRCGFGGTLPAAPQRRVTDGLFKVCRRFPRFFPAITVILFVTIVLFLENPNNQ